MKTIAALILALLVCVSVYAGNEQQTFAQARAAFKKRDFKRATDLYSAIGKNSLRWSLAKEELAWSQFRVKDYAHAMANVRSLTNDFMSSKIDLEPYLLQSLILFYNCDYKGVFKVLKDVKQTMGEYVKQIESLSQGNWSQDQLLAMEKLLAHKKLDGLEPKFMNVLPRYFYLDSTVITTMRSEDRMMLRLRFKELAQRDNERNHRILQYLNLVEIESVQRAFVPSKFAGMEKTAVRKDNNTMVFNNDQELWADEIDKTQADLAVCHSKTGSTL